MAVLMAKQIQVHLKAVPHWSKRAQTISRTFKFEGFLDGIRFVRRIADKAESYPNTLDILLSLVILLLFFCGGGF